MSLRTSRPRICARFDLKGSNLVKGIGLEGLAKIGDPNPLIAEYFKSDIDEIHIWNVVSSLFGTEYIGNILESIANNVFVPIAAGGGIQNLEQIRYLLSIGCDKVIINSAAVREENFVKMAVACYGSSTISVGVDVLKAVDGSYQVVIQSGRTNTGIELNCWLEQLYLWGVGEVILTSVATEGRCKGYDMDLLRYTNKTLPIPLVMHGGAGSLTDLITVASIPCISGVSAASLFHLSYLRSNPSLSNQLKLSPATRPIIERLAQISSSSESIPEIISKFHTRFI